MATAETHYKTHLGPVYSWMLGDLDAAFVRSAAEIEDLPLPAARGVAVDLGAGLGLHALPLAKRGFDVVAIDNCKVLLDDLNSRRGSLPIAIHNADLGVFATTFRDYATSKLEGDQRFILVRAAETRILTCFLEYQEHLVMVHDLLYEKEHGRWRQAVSSYPKLRLAPAWLMVKLSALGFSVKSDTTPGGMVRIVATKN